MTSTIGTAAVAAMLLGGWFGVEGNGRIKEEVREVPAFRGVEVGGGVEADVRVGKERRVSVTTDENLLQYVTTTVEDGVLRVRQTRSLEPKRGVRLTVVTPELTSLAASGGVELTAEVAPTDSFKLEGSGGAQLRVKGLDAQKLSVDLSGGTDATLAGKAQEATWDLSGGVDLDAKGLEVKRARLDASGGVDARLHVAETLSGSASGGVAVKVAGRPAMKVETSGAASVQSE